MGKKKKFANRELSQLMFNERVLSEAVNADNPLLERGKFLSIVESNLDEFYMVRVGGLVHKLAAGDNKKDISGMSPLEQLVRIHKRAHKQVDKLYDIIQGQYVPALEEVGIHFLSFESLTKEQTEWLSNYFDLQLAPLLTPRAIDANRPFPLLAPKCIHLALLLPPKSPSGEPRFALISVPNVIARVIMLPMGKGRARGVMLEDVIAAFAPRLFDHVKPLVCQPFRITRNSDFLVDDSDADTLIIEMRKNLKKRKWGHVVRLEIPANFDSRLLSRLKKYLGINNNVLFRVRGALNPNYFMKQISGLEGFDDLRFPPFSPRVQTQISESKNMFDAISKGDILLHHPFDSFQPVIRFMNDAADDPHVLAIKQTLYRVSGKSPIVAALSRAAKNGKQVTVLIEVRARFDEENNINWCLELEKAGCHVIYGVPNLKAHSKITLVVRKEGTALKRYVHLSTGNYNDITAKLYTDIGLFTADETFGNDASAFFNAVTGYADTAPMQHLIAAPKGIRSALNHLIETEIRNAQQGLPSGITAKVNALTDKKMIKRLYQAANAGVPVRLIVRGACCARVNGERDLRVRSIVGRFLEHSRIYMFENAGEKKVFLSSADLMTRNLNKRVELMFPVLESTLCARIEQMLALELSDNKKAWALKKSGAYARVAKGEPSINSQEESIFYS